jgi:hypothetical protein
LSIADRATGRDIVDGLAAHLEAQGITLDEIGRVSRLGGYQAITKNDETGEAEKHQLYKFELSPAFESGPEWQPVDRGPAVKLPTSKRKPAEVDGWRTAVVWPDTQIGYWRDLDGTLVSTHDEAAVGLALDVVADLKPAKLIRVGDDLDLPELGKYRTSPAFADTTQASIDRNTVLGAEQRNAVGADADIVYLAGNHEERLSNYLLDNAHAAYRLRPGRFAAEELATWPAMSIPSLCRLDEFGIDYRPGFPAADYELADDLRVVHGLYVGPGGGTAGKYLAKEKTSVIYGHIHRREYAARSSRYRNELREQIAASPGCLARLDGSVPSTRGATDLDGRPLIAAGREDWQQGLGVVHYHEDGVRWTYENIEIKTAGATRWAQYAGRQYERTTPQ